jgi:PAS domain S-box-containing protein
MKRKLKILLVEDNESDYILFKNFLEDIKIYDFDLQWTPFYAEALTLMKRNEHDVYILDYLLGANTGLELLKEAVSWGCDAPIILLTGIGDRKVDLDAMEMGASDFLIKGDIDAQKLERSIRYSLERNATLKALKESEAKYRTVFESSRDMIFISDEEGKLIDFNDSATKIFGYAREELLNSSLSILYYNREEGEDFLNSLRLTGSITNNELALKNKEGVNKHCLISASLQRSSEGKLYIFGVIHDITRRKKVERDLVIAEKIAVTGRLAQMLAHEIRNPLTTINLVVGQMEFDLRGEDYKNSFDMIKNNCRRINDLISEVLLSSKPAKIKMGKHNLSKLIDDTLVFAMDRIKIKKIKVTKDYASNVCDITVDEVKIKTALLNIIINAIEAMPEKGGVMKIRTRQDEGKCYIEIEDNGVGIEKENLRKLFEPYFTGKPQGMGLGLANAHNIIQSHKGTIDVESEPNKRTKFTIGLNL